jgi:hypothetical protein
MRSEQLYLTDMIEAAEAIERFVAGLDRDDFLQDELRQSAVIQNEGGCSLTFGHGIDRDRPHPKPLAGVAHVVGGLDLEGVLFFVRI